MIFGHPDSTLLPASSTTSPLTPISFSSFKFNTIGKEPDLLRRISAPNPDEEYDDDEPSRSSSSSPNLEDQLLLPDHPDSRSRPTLSSQSLAERIGNFDVDMTDVTPITDQNRSNTSPTPSSNVQDPSDSSQTDGRPKLLIDPVPTVIAQLKQLAADINTQPSTTLNHVPQPTPPITPSVSAVNDDVSLAVLRTLHSRLSSALSLLNTPNTTNAILLAQSAKTTSAAVLSSAQRAHVLSQQSIISAQEAVLAAQECLKAAQEAQERADAAMAAIQSLSSGRDDYEVFVGFKNDLNALDKWINKREADEADHRTHTPGDESVSMVVEEAVIPPRDRGKLRAFHDKPKRVCQLQPRAKSVVRPTVEEEADAAAIAWNQERERSAERRKIVEEELRKRRDVEAALEQERLRAQAEADAHEAKLAKARTERIEAEELEEARQANEAREIERRQREVEAMRKEAAMFAMQQQKAEDERVQQEQEAKRKAAEAEKEKEARLLLEQEQKYKEIQEREERIKQNEVERVKAIAAEEARQQILRQEQEMKRQQIQAQKQIATQQAALKIIAEREKQKLGQSTSASPTSENQQAPQKLGQSTSASPTSEKQQAPVTLPAPIEFGNIVSRKTLISGSGSQVKSKAKGRVISGGIMLGAETEQPLASPSCPPLTLPTPSVNSSSQSANGLIDVVQTPILQLSTQLPVSGPENAEPATELNKAPSLPVNTIKRSPTPRNVLDSKDMGLKGSGNGSDSSSLPPIKHLSKQSPTPPFLSPTSPASLIQLKPAIISVHREGSDPGNLPIVPPSRTGPISPEAQHTNLRFLDASAIRRNKSISKASAKPVKMEPLPDQLPPENVSTASPLEKAARSQADAGPTRSQKVPFPLREHPQPRTAGAPATASSSTSASELAKKNHPPLPIKPKQKLPNFKKNLVDNEPVAEPMSSTILPPSRPVNSVSTVIPSAAVTPPRYYNSAPRPAVDIYDASSTQMGPDVADTDGWTRPSRDDGVTMRDQPRGMDHYPPPPDNIASSRASIQRRVYDHYSPPSGNVYMQANRYRPASPSRGWARSPPPPDAPRGRGRSSPSPDGWLSPYSPRGRSRTPQPSWDAPSGPPGWGSPPPRVRIPSPPLYTAPAPGNPPPLIGRKRVRDDEVPVAPPARRYRYDQDNPSRDEYASMPHAPQMPSTNENDWSRSAVYGRSPSPDLRPGLASRIAPGPNEWESNAYAVGRGDSYRPSYSTTIRGPLKSRRQQAQPPSQSAQLWNGDIPLGPAITNKTRPPKNQYRPPKEPVAGGSLPGLLSRFSDSTDPTVIQANPPPSKPARNRYNGKGKGGTPQSLEQRISSKPSSLMHRLES